MDRIEKKHTSGHAEQKWIPLPKKQSRDPTKEADITKTRKRRRACPLTQSVYTPRTLLAAHRHVDPPTPTLAADTVTPNAIGMTAENKHGPTTE